MKIYNSKFKDFYDGLYNFGGVDDSNVIYIRETKVYNNYIDEILIDLIDSIRNEDKWFYWKNSIKVSLFGFCGKIYPLYWKTSIIKKDSFAFSLELNKIFESKNKYFSSENYTFNLNPFISIDSPIFIFAKDGFDPIFQDEFNFSSKLHLPTMVSNISLKTLGFHRFFDKYETYQEIETFIGNVLVKREKIEEPSDLIKLKSHGFDSKSFKKAKTKR